jgi:hypothetical protein
LKNLVLGFLSGALVAGLCAHLMRDESASTVDSPQSVAKSPVAHLPGDQAQTRLVSPAALQDSRVPNQERHPSPIAGSSDPRGMGGKAATPNDQFDEIPGGSVTAPTPALASLFEAFRIDCQYGPGYGGRWPHGALLPHTAAWQGGPITFDTIDLEARTARLKTTSGLTRTLDGELDVRVHATDTGLHFTVFAPGGELIVASVYGVLDAQRRNPAVVSFHGPHFDHESAQFYGACSLG